LILITGLLSGSPSVCARNIVLFIGDGMGFEHVQAGRLYLNGTDTTPLFMETLPYAGAAITVLPGGGVTDSATAGTALATGYQHPSAGPISMNAAGLPVRTILERARDAGLRTGIVTTDDIVGATPAAFGAHEASRDYTAQIRNDYLWGDALHSPSLPTVLLGGGYLSTFVTDAVSLEYVFAGSAQTLLGITPTSGRVLGLFTAGPLTRENDRSPDNTEPRLSQMATAALAWLTQAPGGFFLMVEGALIDKISHEGNTDNAKGDLPPEVAQFDAAVAAVSQWLSSRDLLGDTLILVTADHETGLLDVVDGQGITPGTIPAMTLYSTGHSTRNVPVFGSWPPALDGSLIDNTETFFVMEDWLMGLAGAPPIIEDLDVVEITRASARVRWRTVEPSTTWLECGGFVFEDMNRVLYHEVLLTGLSEGSSYSVNVDSTDLAGFTRQASTDFTTAAPDVNAYVLADPVGTGTLSGSYASLTPPSDGLVQTITEVPDGVGSSLDVVYTLGTSASPAEVISISLDVQLTWVNADRFAEDLTIMVWNPASQSFESLPPNTGGLFTLGPGHLYWNGARGCYCIDVRLKDSASVAKEKKGKVSVDVLWAAIVAGEPDLDPPAVPSDLVATQITDGGMDLTAQLAWTASNPSDVAYYRVYRGEITVGTSATPGFVDQVTSGGTYSYTVSAVDSVGNESAPSPAVSVALENLYAPSIPSNLTAVAGDGEVMLAWSPSSEADIDGYNVYRGLDGEAMVCLNQEPVSASSYLDAGRENGVTYYYAVEAVDTGGRISGLSAAVFAIPSSLPTLLATTDGSLAAAGKNWKAVASVAVRDQSQSPVAGASVSGQWFLDSAPLQAAVAGVTDAVGAVTFAAPLVKAAPGQVFKFTLLDVQLAGYRFDRDSSVVVFSATVPAK